MQGIVLEKFDFVEGEVAADEKNVLILMGGGEERKKCLPGKDSAVTLSHGWRFCHPDAALWRI